MILHGDRKILGIYSGVIVPQLIQKDIPLNTPSEFIVPRKWRVQAHGQRIILVKGPNESAEHVLMKAFLWALYLPQYPGLTVEIRVGDRYKPDVVALDDSQPPKPLFWGESGQVSVAKIRSLARRYRSTHFAIAKWAMNLDPLAKIVREALNGAQHSAPFDLLRFPPDGAARFIDSDDHLRLTHDDIEWMRFYAE